MIINKKNINTKKWKLFKVGNYFDVELAEGDIKLDEVAEGNSLLVSACSIGNGIVGYISENGDGVSKKFCGNKLTVDMFCNAFYQDKDFYSVSHGRVNILTPKNNTKFNKYIAMFLITMIKKEQFKYSYGRALYSDETKNMEIKLPQNNKHEPDWNYMEKFIKSLWKKQYNTKVKQKKVSLDIKKWREYKIGDIFEKIEKCKCNCARDLLDGDEIYYVGAKKTGNGIMKKCAFYENLVSKGNCIVFICDGAGSVGYSLYMDKDFIGSTTLQCAYNQKLNKYNAMFLVSVLDKERVKYSYGRKYAPTLKQTIVKLPFKTKKEPDWDYMEKYIKKLQFSDLI